MKFLVLFCVLTTVCYTLQEPCLILSSEIRQVNTTKGELKEYPVLFAKLWQLNCSNSTCEARRYIDYERSLFSSNQTAYQWVTKYETGTNYTCRVSGNLTGDYVIYMEDYPVPPDDDDEDSTVTTVLWSLTIAFQSCTIMIWCCVIVGWCCAWSIMACSGAITIVSMLISASTIAGVSGLGASRA